MRNNQSGFGLVNLILLGSILLGVGICGWLVYDRQPLKTYKSSHSNLQFKYPASWKLTQNPNNSNDTLSLEDITLTGPRHIEVIFKLRRTNHKPLKGGYACTVPADVSLVQNIGTLYKISAFSFHADTLQIMLHSAVNKPPSGYGSDTEPCFQSGNEIFLPGDLYATLVAEQESSATNPGETRQKYTPSEYVRVPEVKTAIAIFKTFKQ